MLKSLTKLSLKIHSTLIAKLNKCWSQFQPRLHLMLLSKESLLAKLSFSCDFDKHLFFTKMKNLTFLTNNFKKTSSNWLMPDDTRALLLNSRSIRNEVESLMELVSDSSIDISFLTETWLDNNQFTSILSASAFKFNNYPRTSNGRGIVFYIIPALLVNLLILMLILLVN